ncbi:hypothetical protein HF1_11620 [Mycoplasma haemofelis str. Langford 1]|uniref:Uncharacterized protein n=1 Tax=Mycoplasma haemofelis (strain Langford 1) TaxID=941640 RepID=E8ZJ49_MYCHL|nr:hypothetical protein [Mycoplasma haemofelis]CBY93170.1 hypothetical protein HF1_11620 [Mycoplasma haemofelis str. Langford 1]
MPNPAATKALLGLLGATAAGGTTFAGYKILNKEQKKEEAPTTKEIQKVSVAELLKKDKTKQLLVRTGKTGQDAEWKAAWSNYKTKNNSNSENGSDPLKIANWSTEKSREEAPEDFLNKCDAESKKEVVDTNDPIYVNVSTWCTKEVASEA